MTGVCYWVFGYSMLLREKQEMTMRITLRLRRAVLLYLQKLEKQYLQVPKAAICSSSSSGGSRRIKR